MSEVAKLVKEAAEFQYKLAEECPPMPEHFWPEMTVMGSHDGVELCFVMRPEMPHSELSKCLDGLRLALWVDTHWKNANNKIRAHAQESKARK